MEKKKVVTIWEDKEVLFDFLKQQLPNDFGSYTYAQVRDYVLLGDKNGKIGIEIEEEPDA